MCGERPLIPPHPTRGRVMAPTPGLATFRLPRQPPPETGAPPSDVVCQVTHEQPGAASRLRHAPYVAVSRGHFIVHVMRGRVSAEPAGGLGESRSRFPPRFLQYVVIIVLLCY